jgi:hypothetical protein
LTGYTEKVTFSFIDFYKKITENIKSFGLDEITNEEKNIIADNFSRIVKENGILIDTCAENIDLSKYNIAHARCIDDRLITKLIGHNLNTQEDKNQRLECGCVRSIDIGEYNSCSNGCVYCYANYSKNNVVNNFNKHDPLSPLLVGRVSDNDIVNERKILSNKILQK